MKQLIESAIGNGTLPAGATPYAVTRPWPIVLMTGIGAWLVATPLMVLIFNLLGRDINRGPLCYIIGLLCLGGALTLLRRGGKSAFLEQLGLPVLLVAGVMLGTGLYRDLPSTMAGATLALIAIGVAWAVPQMWMRTLLGALACAVCIVTVASQRHVNALQLWSGIQLALLVWVLISAWSDVIAVSAANAARMLAVESIATGWAAALLIGLAYASGKTFLIGALVAPLDGSSLAAALAANPLPRALSLALASAAMAWLARHWPAFRTPQMLAAAALLVGLSWLMPLLGGALLVLAICAVGARWVLAGAAGVASAWIIGSFYYQLDMPLATKGLVMAGAGAAFGLIAWLNSARRPVRATTSAPIPWLMALSLLAILLVVNGGIWQKENLIRNGRPVYIALAPVDPRSLMQGDYMRLNFVRPGLRIEARRSKVVAKIDARGVAVLQREANSTPLAPDEIVIQLPLGDAWYFKEGDGKRWEHAQYGEFRIDSDGRSLLVNLRDAHLETM